MADPSTAPPLVPASIAEAHEKIKPYIHITPLVTSTSMNNIASHPNPSLFLSNNPPPALSSPTTSPSNQTPKINLYFKCENQQKIGAFKARGAHHALIRLISSHGLDSVRSHGVLTHSSGNHAQALALAAKNFGVPSHIIMPSISTPSKIAGTQMYSDDVIFSGSTAAEREAKAKEVAEKTGAILVPPYDHPDIILGQGTAAYEMEQQFKELKQQEQQQQSHTPTDPNGDPNPPPSNSEPPQFDAVLTPLGGGGLLAGTATWFSHTSSSTNQKRTLIFGSEPSLSGANDAELGLSTTPPTRIAHVSSLTIADGLRTPVGHLNWSIISDKAKVEGVYSVTEQEIKWALRLMMERTKLFLEPSAVVPVAVVLFNAAFREMVARKQMLEGCGRAWDVGVVLSGGNTTVEALATLFADEGGMEGGKEDSAERQIGKVGMDGGRKAEDVAG